MYRTAVLVMMGAVLLSVAMTERNMAFQIVALAGYICLKAVFWSLFAVISRNSKVSPVVSVTASGEGSLTAGLFIGNQLNGILGMQYASAIAAITLAILLFAYMFVLNERRVIAITNEPDDDEGEPTRQRFRDRCDQIAVTYKLLRDARPRCSTCSPGAAHPAASPMTSISLRAPPAPTCATSIASSDVHSRQELLDLIENFGE